LALSIAMITGLLLFIAARGAATFWPAPLELVEAAAGRRALGEVSAREAARGDAGGRRLLRIANFELTGNHFEWFDDGAISATSRPPWATAVERLEGGRFHGFPVRLLHGTEVVAEGPEATWAAFEREHGPVRRRWRETVRIDKHDRGRLQRELRARGFSVFVGEEAIMAGDSWPNVIQRSRSTGRASCSLAPNSSTAMVRSLGLLVGIDDVSDDAVANDVFAVEVHEGDPLDLAEQVFNADEARFSTGDVNLGDVTSDNHL
jgi:hypothetical protein